MPAYRYTHDCGMEQTIYLSENKETKIVTCYRCGRNVTARQVRDKSIKEGEADGTRGLLRNTKQQPGQDDVER